MVQPMTVRSPAPCSTTADSKLIGRDIVGAKPPNITLMPGRSSAIASSALGTTLLRMRIPIGHPIRPQPKGAATRGNIARAAARGQAPRAHAAVVALGWGMRLETASATDIGLVRARNEDCVSIRSDAGLGVTLLTVADGMGGAPAGDVASARAVETFQRRALELLASETVDAGRALHEALLEGQRGSSRSSPGARGVGGDGEHAGRGLCHSGERRLADQSGGTVAPTTAAAARRPALRATIPMSRSRCARAG